MSGTLKFSAAALLACVSTASAQESPKPQDGLPWPPVHTFSIPGYDSVTGEVGAAVQSRMFSVGNGVLWGEADVGVAATQAIVDVSYGPKATESAGYKIGHFCSAQGNILAGPGVVDSMVAAFEHTTGYLSFRLLAAIEAGQLAGGDKRGMQSAAMLIVKKDGGVWLHNDVVLRLQVDDSPEPIKELRRLVEQAAQQRERRTSR